MIYGGLHVKGFLKSKMVFCVRVDTRTYTSGDRGTFLFVQGGISTRRRFPPRTGLTLGTGGY